MYINHRYNRFLNSIFLIASHDSALSNINLFHYSRDEGNMKQKQQYEP